MIGQIKQLYYKYEEVISYLFWGIMTTAVNVLIFSGLHIFTNMNYMINNFIAWVISVLFAYITNKAYVFHSPSKSFLSDLKEMTSFFGGRVATLVVEWILLWIGITLMHQNQILVKILENIVVIILNYFWSKWAVFKNSTNKNQPK
ncbi:GtrA family protein [Lentilactobacillus otakiensis]|uniref:Cell wall teichoic acid glycosylation protein gtcA n=1 Tax=Lentilactobacillus otakiensis DSM 19908 = JCM 15040 TaxID=1423780 RepID=S4NS21_9LACO|nr:GtrA family protein [Lentilactobacillus otakiensis]KRL09682.1 GtrA-like protein [Lentilactobacillus otakiensis DSM 19908 = JCM 15040]MBZ3777781.1 GtrA family protein [Lentilactobacillus otakiensis]MDV3518346.1 GtrA family protein [Lentilactobacillus otakiensis]GAD16733.1 cell wall teichoic acid glycosylation protein gtcA [Lentilactobacillus otakiensis DSM 19908 = JCM 15040]